MIKNLLVILLFFYTLNVTSQAIFATLNSPVEAGSLSVADVNNAPATISPNPAVDVVNILPINGASFIGYDVFDITGKVQLSNAASDIYKVDVSQLSGGVYFLQLDNYNAIKFIKK